VLYRLQITKLLTQGVLGVSGAVLEGEKIAVSRGKYWTAIGSSKKVF